SILFCQVHDDVGHNIGVIVKRRELAGITAQLKRLKGKQFAVTIEMKLVELTVQDVAFERAHRVEPQHHAMKLLQEVLVRKHKHALASMLCQYFLHELLSARVHLVK